MTEPLSSEIQLECPACKGFRKIMARIQYKDRRKPCTEELRDCPICNGSGQVSSDQHRLYAQKYAK